MSVTSDMDGMLAEVQAQLGRTVTLRARAVGSLNTTTGKLARTPTDYTLVAVAGPVTTRRNGNGAVVEERTYTFAAADIGTGVLPVETWHVIDGSDTRPIVRVEKDANGRAYRCVTRVDRKTGS